MTFNTFRGCVILDFQAVKSNFFLCQHTNWVVHLLRFWLVFLLVSTYFWLCFNNEFNLDRISYDTIEYKRKFQPKYSSLVYWWGNSGDIASFLFYHIKHFLASLFRPVRTNWHKIQILTIFRGMFGFSSWHNFSTEVKFSFVFFVHWTKHDYMLEFWVLSKNDFSIWMVAGAAPLFTLGVTFIDENVSKKMSSVYLGE